MLAPRVAVVRFGRLRHIANFMPRGDVLPLVRRDCIVASARGLEVGRVLAVLDSEGYPTTRPLIRMATREDLVRAHELRARSAEDLDRVLEITGGVDGMRTVAVERLFDGERLVIYYTASLEVEVPVLLRELRKTLDIEITLQQLGARQRARATGGCGSCGRSLCCSTFLRSLDPVPMRMAKVQGIDLSPHLTAGVCGRLKCCLRYENPLYESHRKGLPRLGWKVTSRRVSGRVLAIDILRRKVLVQPEVGRARPVFADEIEHAGPPLRTPLPTAGEVAPPPIRVVERGWSVLAKRLWRRMRKDKNDPAD